MNQTEGQAGRPHQQYPEHWTGSLRTEPTCLPVKRPVSTMHSDPLGESVSARSTKVIPISLWWLSISRSSNSLVIYAAFLLRCMSLAVERRLHSTYVRMSAALMLLVIVNAAA